MFVEYNFEFKYGGKNKKIRKLMKGYKNLLDKFSPDNYTEIFLHLEKIILFSERNDRAWFLDALKNQKFLVEIRQIKMLLDIYGIDTEEVKRLKKLILSKKLEEKKKNLGLVLLKEGKTTKSGKSKSLKEILIKPEIISSTKIMQRRMEEKAAEFESKYIYKYMKLLSKEKKILDELKCCVSNKELRKREKRTLDKLDRGGLNKIEKALIDRVYESLKKAEDSEKEKEEYELKLKSEYEREDLTESEKELYRILRFEK